MRYLPVLDVWNPVIYAAIDSGALRLQRGQWIKCGPDATYLSRYYGHVRRGGHVQHITAYHGPEASKNFLTRCARPAKAA